MAEGSNHRDKAANQLVDFAKNQKTPDQATTTFGCPHDKQSIQQSITVGKTGPVALEDVSFLEIMSHFDRERIPERVVHAKGAAAFGYFETTHDITKYTKLAPFAKIGKRTPMAVRFSTVGGELGSADTVRDPRGFAMKFYTEEGNWDLVGNNTPIFFIRDPILFPDFIHTQKRNPKTNLKDPDMFWDFISLRPETTHQVSFLFSDRGIPDGYRHMNGYGSHTYKMINKDGETIFCKFHFKTDQKIKNIPVDTAGVIAGQDPDYSLRDLHVNIADGNFPTWSLEIQVMTHEQAEKYRWNPFDVTKVWLHADHPPIPVGKMVLNRNAENHFAEVEQLAFSPSSFIPGIQPSQDRMLQGRLFSYHDTHLHRLGTNYGQLPVNRPLKECKNYERDGASCIFSQGGAPNYHPNSFSGPAETSCPHAPSYKVPSTDVQRHDSADDDNFSQVNRFWNHTLNEEERERLASNIAGHLKDAIIAIQKRTVANFASADPDYGNRIQKKLDVYNLKNK